MKKWALPLTVSLSLMAFGAHGEDTLEHFRAKANNTHQVTLLNHGLASFEQRLEMIDRAQKSIDVEYFIYATDKSARIFTQALLKKAKEGVKVRMLLDYAMIKGTFSSFYAHEMAKKGIEVKYFNPTATVNQFSGTYRNHRKVLLIDGVEAVTGGRNIADEYFDLREDFNFLDRDILVKGEIVDSIQETFDDLWDSKHSKTVARPAQPKITDSAYDRGEAGADELRFESDLGQFEKKVEEAQEFLTVVKSNEAELRAKGKEELDKEYKGTCENMSFHSELPIIGRKNRRERIIKHDISERFKTAKSEILFDSPYFIVERESKEALNTALKNKVKLELLTNSLNSTDAIYVYAVLDTIIKPWIKKGLGVHIFKGSVPTTYPIIDESISKARFGVHAKSFVFDNKDTVIGTYNFDPRSANLNTEMTLSCEDNAELAKAVSDDIRGRIEDSVHLDSKKSVNEAEYMNVGFFKRLGYLFVKIPANIFGYLL